MLTYCRCPDGLLPGLKVISIMWDILAGLPELRYLEVASLPSEYLTHTFDFLETLVLTNLPADQDVRGMTTLKAPQLRKSVNGFEQSPKDYTPDCQEKPTLVPMDSFRMLSELILKNC